MRFALTTEQVAFAEAIDRLLAKADTPAVTRAWAAGDRGPGLELWAALAGQGVTALRVAEEHGGLGASWLDLVVAFEQLGYHAVPGPWIETVAVAPGLLPAADTVAIAAGARRVSLAVTPVTPYVLDADAADAVYRLDGTRLSLATVEQSLASVDPARHLSAVTAGPPVATLPAPVAATAIDAGALAAAAQLLGAARRLLTDTVAYAKARKQFGRAIGEFQAVKHLLADVLIAIDFCRPLVHGAALSLDDGGLVAARDVSAAKVSANEAASLAARTALQVHGAIGYTAEFDLSLWLGRVQALASVWGTSAYHRARVLASLAARS